MSFIEGMITEVINKNCLEAMQDMKENSIDSILTDPPYGLQFMGKEWDTLWRNQTDADKEYVENKKKTTDGLTSRMRNLPDMKNTNDKMMQEWHYNWAVEALRVAKPGAHMLAFGGTRTHHRLMCAIEDAGWEIRDTMMWVHGQGFPKSHNISKALDKIVDITTPATPEAKQWDGYGTGLKPAWEPITLCRKPVEGTIAQNVLKWGVGGLNIDGCRIETNELKNKVYNNNSENISYQGRLKQTYLNENDTGRFPANFLHDGSDEVMELFPECGSGSYQKQSRKRKGFKISGSENNIQEANAPDNYGDSGSAARFFYCAKPSKKERNMGCEELPDTPIIRHQPHNSKNLDERYAMTNKNDHPTVKPIKLLRYLARLITPPGGTILDPFAGSGSTGVAAVQEGFNSILIEVDEHYCDIIRSRCK